MASRSEAGNSDQGTARLILKALMEVGYFGVHARENDPGRFVLDIDSSVVVNKEELDAFDRWLNEKDID